jgi:hypothetical protein
VGVSTMPCPVLLSQHILLVACFAVHLLDDLAKNLKYARDDGDW